MRRHAAHSRGGGRGSANCLPRSLLTLVRCEGPCAFHVSASPGVVKLPKEVAHAPLAVMPSSSVRIQITATDASRYEDPEPSPIAAATLDPSIHELDIQLQPARFRVRFPSPKRVKSPSMAAATEITHRMVDANGIRIHLAEAGAGPLVLFCHGFPESWHSWRWQLTALAEAGYHAVAPDMRGYGETDRPEEIEKYTICISSATWSASSMCSRRSGPSSSAMTGGLRSPGLRPSCGRTFSRGVVGLSVPFLPRGSTRPTGAMPQNDHFLAYQLYFQTPGIAEAELEPEPRDAVRRMLSFRLRRRAARGGQHVRRRGARDGSESRRRPRPHHRRRAAAALADRGRRRLLRPRIRPHRLSRRPQPGTATSIATGSCTAPFAGLRVVVPALFAAGDRDIVVQPPGVQKLIANLKTFGARTPRHDHAAGLRPLDPAGAGGRGQRGASRISARAG